MSILDRPADEFVNDPDIERLWAIKAIDHMTIYYKLISTIPSTRELRLTAQDDLIYEKFRKDFSQFKIDIIDIETLKSDEAKAVWRVFCNHFEKIVDDFNFATFLRLDASGDYSEENSCIVPRIQFLAIEIARNREGINEKLKIKSD